MKSEAAARRRRQHGSSARGRRRREDFNSGRVDCRPLQHPSTRRTGIIFLLFPFCPEINFQPLLTWMPIVLQVPVKGMKQGETSVSLPVFIQDMSAILLTTTPPGHTGRRQPRPFLSPQSQRLIFRLIKLLFEAIPLHCFRQIRRVHIMVCLQSERPYFSSRIQESPDRTYAQMCKNVNSMGLLIRDMIMYQPDQGERAGKPSVLPREVKHLINLMLLPDPIRMKVPIQYHSCLVPIEYRGFLFTIEYQFTMDVLRYADREGVRYVLRGLEPMGDWSVNVRNSNRYLQQFFNKGRYDPYGLKFQSNPILEPLDYNRNVPSHTLEGSVSRRELNGMRFTRATINRALYFEFEMVLANMSVGLHRLGHLKHLGLAVFFPY